MHREGDDLAVIHVVEHGQDHGGHLEDARRLFAECGIDARPIALAGNAARSICVTAERDAYDTIVLGRRNTGDGRLMLLGSVAARVVSGAGCDVVVVA
jgi:nucleotide-binding universal stress UspA family protein